MSSSVPKAKPLAVRQPEPAPPPASRRMAETHSLKRLLFHAEFRAVVICGILIALAWAAGHVSEWVSAALYLSAFVTGGYASAREGLVTLIRERDLDVNLLMILAALGASCIGYWAEGAVLIFIFALSGALESYTTERSSRDISSLMDLKPETAVLVRNHTEEAVPVEQLVEGDLVLVRPGERIPADGTVRQGSSGVNQASITGESMPVDKNPGDPVYAGTLNGQGALFVRVDRPGESTLFSKIIRLVQEAQSEKPGSQRFMESFERIYARAVVLVTVILVLAVPLLGGGWKESFYRAMVFLVVASPCALVASIMPAMLSAVSNGARRGVLFKGGAHLEHLSRTRVVAFDKTGTLTLGKPSLTDIVPFQNYDERELLRLAASLESLSEHPLAKAIVEEAVSRGMEPEHPESLRAANGWGVEVQFRGEDWKLGKAAFMPGMTEKESAAIQRLENEGKTVVVLQNGHGIAGILALRDSVRPEAREAVEDLHGMGIRTAMLTGDRDATARAIAREAGIDLVYADLLPEDKVAKIRSLRQSFGQIAMVGDGVNDAPALAAATVGIAMGAAGSAAALDTADLVLMKDDLRQIAAAVRLGRRTAAVVRQNMIFAAAVIAALVSFNFLSGIPLPLGVVGHESSTLLVILNGLRLLRK